MDKLTPDDLALILCALDAYQDATQDRIARCQDARLGASGEERVKHLQARWGRIEAIRAVVCPVRP